MIEPYYSDPLVTIYHGDCRDVLPELDPVETCITDPPYGLAFMGKAWDHAVPDAAYWSAVRDAVKPGGHLLAFGGTRLWHWLAVGIEQGGWTIRDTLMWLYGSGFPKSLDISRAIDTAAGAEREVVGENPNGGRSGSSSFGQVRTDGKPWVTTAPATDAAKTWDGWGTALKPAWEPVILAMNPLDGTFAENAERHGVAGLNLDGTRIGTEEITYVAGALGGENGKYGTREKAEHPTTVTGRWPANLALDENAAAMLDEQSGDAGAAAPASGPTRRGPSHSVSRNAMAGTEREPAFHDDSGGASRFFYTSKASKADRGEGNTHPTVKPTDLMEWLCRLTATPAGGVVLDPFMGSGSTLVAAASIGRRVIGIDLNEEYCEIAARRILDTQPGLGL